MSFGDHHSAHLPSSDDDQSLSTTEASSVENDDSVSMANASRYIVSRSVTPEEVAEALRMQRRKQAAAMTGAFDDLTSGSLDANNLAAIPINEAVWEDLWMNFDAGIKPSVRRDL
jgi:hypothetical protein